MFTNGSLSPQRSRPQRDSLGTGADSFKRMLGGAQGTFSIHPSRIFFSNLLEPVSGDLSNKGLRKRLVVRELYRVLARRVLAQLLLKRHHRRMRWEEIEMRLECIE